MAALAKALFLLTVRRLFSTWKGARFSASATNDASAAVSYTLRVRRLLITKYKANISPPQ